MKHPNRNGKADQRKQSAAARQAAYAALSLDEKIARAIPGSREHTRLKARRAILAS